MAICKIDWHFKLGQGKKERVNFNRKSTVSCTKKMGATYQRTFSKCFLEGAMEASSTLFSTYLRAGEDGRRFYESWSSEI